MRELNLFGATCGKPIRYFGQMVENRRVGRHVAPLERRLAPSQPLKSKMRGLLWARALRADWRWNRRIQRAERGIYTTAQLFSRK